MPSDEAAVWEYGTADRLAAAASGVAKKLRKINPAERRQERRNVLKVSAARAAESGSEDISRKWAILNGHGNRPGYSIYAQRTSTTETQGSCGAVGAQEGNFQYSPLARTKILIERVHPCLLTRFALHQGEFHEQKRLALLCPGGWRSLHLGDTGSRSKLHAESELHEPQFNLSAYYGGQNITINECMDPNSPSCAWADAVAVPAAPDAANTSLPAACRQMITQLRFATIPSARGPTVHSKLHLVAGRECR